MGLSPIDMKGFIPKTQELSELENQRSIKDKSHIMVQQNEQDKRVEREINQVNDSENTEKARIQKEKEEQQRKKGASNSKTEEEETKQAEKNSLGELNVSVKRDRLPLGRKIDMKA